MSTIIEAVQAEIRATNHNFEVAFERGDAAGAAAVYTSTAQAFPPNSGIVSGRGALQSFWQAVMDMGVTNVTLETVELTECGDMLYEVGMATLSGTGGTVLDTAKFIVIWQQDGGKWKWHRDIWNSINPA